MCATVPRDRFHIEIYRNRQKTDGLEPLFEDEVDNEVDKVCARV